MYEGFYKNDLRNGLGVNISEIIFYFKLIDCIKILL